MRTAPWCKKPPMEEPRGKRKYFHLRQAIWDFKFSLSMKTSAGHLSITLLPLPLLLRHCKPPTAETRGIPLERGAFFISSMPTTAGLLDLRKFITPPMEG